MGRQASATRPDEASRRFSTLNRASRAVPGTARLPSSMRRSVQDSANCPGAVPLSKQAYFTRTSKGNTGGLKGTNLAT